MDGMSGTPPGAAPTPAPPALDLSAGGETGALVQAFDWASTPLGPIEAWPGSLRTVTALVLRSPVPMVLLWGESGIMIYNDAFSRFAGCRHPGLLGSRVREGWPEVADFNDHVMRIVLAGGTLAYRDQELTLHRHGRPEQVWMDLDYSPVVDETGRPVGVLAVVIETTERVLAERQREAAEAALRETEAHVRHLADQLPQIVWEATAEGENTYLNRRWYEFTGEREGAVGQGSWLPYLHPDDVGPSVAAWRASLSSSRPFEHEYRFREASTGAYRWQLGRAIPVRDASGAIAYWLGTCTDIDDQKRAELLRREAERRQAFLLRLSDRLRDLAGPQEITAAAAEMLGRQLGANRVGYGEVDEAEDAISGERDWTDGTVPSITGRFSLSGFGSDLVAEARAGRTIRVDDVRAEPRIGGLVGAYEAIGVGAFVSVPLVKEGRLRAVLSVHQDRPRTWSDADVALAEEAAERTWAAVEQARAEGALRESEARYRTLFDSMDEGFCILQLVFNEDDEPVDYRFADVNPAFERQTGLKDALGRSVRELVPGLEPFWFETYGRVALTGEPTRFVDHARAMGRWFDVSACRIGEPRARRVAVLFNDITDRQQAEAALRESEARLRALTDNLPSGMVYQLSTGRDGSERRFLYVSQSHGRLTGAPADAVLADARIPYELILPEDRPALVAAEAAAIRDQTPFDVEARFRRADTGEVRWCRIISAPRAMPDGSLVWDGIQIDTTDQKRAEERLRESEALFQGIVNSVDQMIWSTRPDGYHDFYNQRWYDYTGVPEGSTDGEAWNGMFHPDDREHAWARWRHSLETGEPYRIEYRLRHRSGAYRWVLGRAQAVRDERGRIVRWFGTCTDIQDIVEAREVLARSREELERLVEERTADRDRMWRLSTDIMLVARFDAVITAVNPAWTTLLGWREDELIGMLFTDLVHPDDVNATLAEAGKLSQGHTTLRFENRYRHRDGSYRWLSWTAVPDERFIHAVGRDVTAEKERQAELEATQEALRQAQKMEAVGQLTGGIAHDFNNLLTGVIGSLDMMQRRIGQGQFDRVERYATTAITSANRAAALTHRLLAFSRRQPLDPKPVNANRLVTGMEELLRRTIGEAIRLEIVTAGGLWQTLCDPHQLESALLNLAINARDAMPEGGKLTIETCNAHLDNAYAARQREVRPGQYVCICVTDTGTGMSPDVIAKAFDPFFTTKPIGQGTGLGLSMIYGFARQSEGYAKIYSELGQGTTVKLYLPRYYGEAEEAEAAPGGLTEAHRAEAGEVVLVVEDESAVRDLVVDVLQDLGYRAVQAADGPTGLRLLQSDMRVDLLVTDVGLPGLNGRQLADAARQHRPSLKVLFMTGYAENATIANGFLEPGMQMITKPFAVEALATRIRDMVEARDG